MDSRAIAAAGHESSDRAGVLLVVDDPRSAVVRDVEAALEPLGVRLVCARTPSDAVAVVEVEDFAVVLLDLEVPELDGVETAALLRKVERARAVPVVILVADVRLGVPPPSEASETVDFLPKPIDAVRLATRVQTLLERYRERAAPLPAIDAEMAEESGRISERLIAATARDDRADVIEALLRIHAALGEELDVDGMARRFVDETTALTGAQAGAFRYETRGTARTLVASGSGPVSDRLLGRIPPGEASTAVRASGGSGSVEVVPSPAELAAAAPEAWRGLLDACVARLTSAGEARLVVHVRDVARASRAEGWPAGVRSLLAARVASGRGLVEGALVLVHERPGAFDGRDEELLAVASRHAATSLGRACLYEEARAARSRAELAELELRAGAARLRLALDSTGLGTWELNPGTGALRWDTRCKALFGLSPAESVDYDGFLALVHDDDRARVDAAVRRTLDGEGEGAFEIEYRTARPHDGDAGGERWIAATAQAVLDQRRPVRLLGSVLDVTAKKRIEQERLALLTRERESRTEAEIARARAEAASRAKDEFLATVSHELRNPLNAILGWSRLLLDEPSVAPARLRRGLEVIERNARAQVQLVEDILEVSRVITGKLRLITSPCHVRSLVESALDTVRSAAHAKGVVLESWLEADVGVVVADPDRMQQVLWNLLSNAVKFTPRGGIVRVAARRDDDGVEIEVGDTGEGIDAEFLPYVFDRFRQADGSTTRRHGGLGLGLAIVRHIVELHGGTVGASSDGRGKGATLRVRLPRQVVVRTGEARPAPTVARLPPPERCEPSPLAGRRVLVLDDEEDMRELLAMILERAGATVARAASVDEALRSLERELPDVVVSDLAMPAEDGYAFVRRVRGSEREDIRRLPLVAMTAYARAEDRERVLAAGYQRHVAKPVEPPELVGILAQLVAAPA